MTVFTYDEIKEQGRRLGITDPDRLEEFARRAGVAPPAPDPAQVRRAERDARVLENKEQLEVRKRFHVCGFESWNLSQARRSKQTPGLADLWLMHVERGVALWWETKRQVGGKHSPAQLRFAAGVRACKVGYGTGDRHDAEDWLIAHGFAHRVGGVFELLKRGPHHG